MALARRGELTVRIGYHLFPQTAGQELNDLRRFVSMVRYGDGDEWLRCKGAGENLTWSAADYENFAQPRPGTGGHGSSELEDGRTLVRDAGWGFRLHATYDETIDHDLTVFEKVARRRRSWGAVVLRPRRNGLGTQPGPHRRPGRGALRPKSHAVPGRLLPRPLRPGPLCDGTSDRLRCWSEA